MRGSAHAVSDDQLIGLVYDTALDPDLWLQLLEQLSQKLHATVGVALIQDVVTGVGRGVQSGGRPGLMDDYFSLPVERNFMMREVGALGAGTVLTDEHLGGGGGGFRRSQMYHEFWVPNQLGPALGHVVLRERSYGCMLNFMRDQHGAPFTAEDVRRGQWLGPHLQRAVRISLRLANAEVLAAGAAAALDRLPHGVALLDSSGRACFLNHMAEVILAERDGLGVRNGALTGAKTGDTATLTAAIRRSINPGHGAALQLPRPSGKRSLSVLIAPVSIEASWLCLAPPASLVVITDPLRGGVPPRDRLMQAYRLTPTEASLTMLLLEGHDISETAVRLRITRETARTHLRRILAKTGAHRQSDLMRLLIRELAPIT